MLSQKITLQSWQSKKPPEWVVGQIETPVGAIPVISSRLSFRDRLGAVRVRLDLGRMHYTVKPGLYAVGQPDANAPVLVSANYKLSFDVLRQELGDLAAWILVLDTRGINVWCAAGKGTFGTEELRRKIKSVRLEQIVRHRQLIVPQLGAPGISAPQVKKATGFKVIYGPVRAADLKAFIKSGYIASDSMRQVRFGLPDRFKIIPADVKQGFKYLMLISVIFFILAGLDRSGYSLPWRTPSGIMAVLFLAAGFLAGAVGTPLLLPFIPGRAFALKGGILNVPIFAGLYFLAPMSAARHRLELIGLFLVTCTISSFIAMNFTGASTYTSLSGVRKEMRIAVPLQIGSFAAGFLIWLAARFI